MSILLVLKPQEGFPLEIAAEALTLKTNAIKGLLAIGNIDSAEKLAEAATALFAATSTVKSMEEARVAVKAPVLDAGKRIDTMASEYKTPIQTEIDRVKKLVSTFQEKEAARIKAENDAREKAEKEAAAEAERLRLAEEKRIRDEAEAEQSRLRDEAAAAEEARKTAEAANDPLAELRATAAEAEQDRIAQEIEDSHAKEAQALAAQEAERLSAQSQVTTRPATPTKVKGLATRSYWTFEVTDAHAVYLHDKTLCVVPQVIHRKVDDMIKNGIREIPGLRIYETTETAIRTK